MSENVTPPDAPQRLRLSRKRGFRLPPGAMSVARPTKWGNPVGWTQFYRPGQNTPAQARARAVEYYRQWLTLPSNHAFRAEARAALAGRSLACWCPLGEACHADVLLEVVNA